MTWPKDAKAAISLTYDDGLPDNLDWAIPDLNERGIRGTFYLTTGKRYVQRRVCDWRKAFENGHEIGSHSVRHPCRADAYVKPPRWLPPALRLENWSVEKIIREIDDAADWLRDHIGDDPWRTYAYPCCATAIGDPPDERPYATAVRKHHFAARSGVGGPNDPRAVDLMHIQSFLCNRPTLQELIGHCEQSLSDGGWTVLMFHSIGWRRMRTKRAVHKALLDYLAKNPYWVAPLRDVAKYINAKRNVSG